MTNYSIVRSGNEYIVQADEKSVLKISSRRRAAKLVTDASELLEARSAPAGEDVSIARELKGAADPAELP
jgi:hypothetical protein